MIHIIQVGGDHDGVLFGSDPLDPGTQPAVVHPDLKQTDLRLEWKDAHARGREMAARTHHKRLGGDHLPNQGGGGIGEQQCIMRALGTALRVRARSARRFMRGRWARAPASGCPQ